MLMLFLLVSAVTQDPANSNFFGYLLTSLVTIITGGAGLKWYNSWLKNKSKDGLDFRANLLERIQDMSTKLEEMYQKQLNLVEQNAQLKAELQAAHNEIRILRGEVKILSNEKEEKE